MASVLVMGAGAVGSYYGALLARSGHSVHLVARGAHAERLRDAGSIAVREAGGNLWHAPVTSGERPGDAAPDLAIITTKSHHTDQAARALQPLIAPTTRVLSLQNGVENVARIDAVLGDGRAMAGQAFVGVWIDPPGTVVHGAEGRVSIGDPRGGATERARAVHGLLASAWEVDLAADIVFDQWKKLLWNVGFNALCAITGCTAGDALARPDSRAIVRAAMAEVVALANANGIALGENDIDEMARDTPSLRDYHPSTSRDLDAGKQLERDALCGFVVREGRARAIATPVNAMLDALLALREQVRDRAEPGG